MNRYNNLNGFRAFCAIGIALMHILANISPTPHLHNITPVIEWFTNFVFLFFIISSFSLCCGYYERIKTGSITLNCFYTKRYWRILPFFAFLSLIDIMIGFSKGSLFEAFMNCTLVFGLLPNNSLEVIGVGWFLGTVFLFYMLFRLSGNFWLVSFKISYLCLPLFYETRTTPSCHPSGCAYRQL